MCVYIYIYIYIHMYTASEASGSGMDCDCTCNCNLSFCSTTDRLGIPKHQPFSCRRLQKNQARSFYASNGSCAIQHCMRQRTKSYVHHKAGWTVARTCDQNHIIACTVKVRTAKERALRGVGGPQFPPGGNCFPLAFQFCCLCVCL